jgi:ER-bound oxygenase mpaB/B'/Rubber oxygenase, catalytic domain
VYLDTCFEFPFDTTRSLEFALFRTFAVPSIGRLLASTGEFTERAQKRYDDTDLIISTFVEHGHSSPLGRRAIRRMNQLHGRFEISNDDFLYVLSTFVFEPIRWNDRFGWRRSLDEERLAGFHFWREVGALMGIRNIPADFRELERFNVEYERARFAATEAGRRVGHATRDMFLAWFPVVPRRLGARGLYAVMDEPLLRAFGFPKPPASLRRGTEAALRARSRAVRALPPRRRPKLRTALRHRTYPRGFELEALGPPPSAAACAAEVA